MLFTIRIQHNQQNFLSRILETSVKLRYKCEQEELSEKYQSVVPAEVYVYGILLNLT